MSNGAERGDPSCTWQEGDPAPACTQPSHPALTTEGNTIACGAAGMLINVIFISCYGCKFVFISCLCLECFLSSTALNSRRKNRISE